MNVYIYIYNKLMFYGHKASKHEFVLVLDKTANQNIVSYN